MKKSYTVVFIGNPNAGKSTIFNRLTGMKQHTGNWSGKTVGCAYGKFRVNGMEFTAVDLPGIYSLDPVSRDEEAAVDFLKDKKADVSVFVADAGCLERSLPLIISAAAVSPDMLLCLNMADEAKRRGITINTELLSKMLHMPVISTCGTDGTGLDMLKSRIAQKADKGEKSYFVPNTSVEELAAEIYAKTVKGENNITDNPDRKTDRIVLSRHFGLPLMFMLLALIFWLTAAGANYPSSLLESLFAKLGTQLRNSAAFMPLWLRGLLFDGIYDTMTCVIAVMLPPMAIFFPMFTLLEDSGLLPRAAVCSDCCMRCAKAHGKMALTICMGFGCNAVGVTAAKIIESPRERLIAILTNSFIPCNGRFPTLMLMITLFLASNSFDAALLLCLAVFFSLAVTLIVSRLLAESVLKGKSSSTVIELPPYRRPRIGTVLVRSLLDRTLFVLGRAISAAAPAGAVIWLLQNLNWGGTSLLAHFTQLLDPFGKLMGLDGCVLTGFILGIPANEIVLPIILTCYNAPAAMPIKETLITNSWTAKTAVCAIILCICHFPCATTLLTIKKETGSIKQTFAAFLLPAAVGVILCCAVNAVWSIII
ncbi:MAG: ferrous iron transporter B [Firmicutes bacterium]|nr:ferrous iron transporter B [Bacillota bacterium]